MTFEITQLTKNLKDQTSKTPQIVFEVDDFLLSDSRVNSTELMVVFPAPFGSRSPNISLSFI